jgi:hypothetical protein
MKYSTYKANYFKLIKWTWKHTTIRTFPHFLGVGFLSIFKKIQPTNEEEQALCDLLLVNGLIYDYNIATFNNSLDDLLK